MVKLIDALREVTSSIKNWADENKVQKVSGKGLSSNDYTTADKNKVASIPNDLVVLDGKLYLAQDGIAINDSAVTLPSGGGSGGGTSSATITLKNLLDSNTLTVAVGGDAILHFSFESSEDDSGGTAYIYIGDILKGTTPIVSGENSINIGSYIGEGSNRVTLTCMDIYSNSKSLGYTVDGIALRVTSNFDDTKIYSEDISLRYIPYGKIEKTMHFVLDGTDTTVVVSETGKQLTQVIPVMYHGTHLLKIYATATVNGVNLKSNELLFDILYEEEGATTPMIASAYNVTSITQGELINIPFTVYDPSNMETEITLTISKDDDVYFTATRIVDRTRQFWNTRDYPIGNVTFTITYGNISKFHKINVIENDIDISVKETDLEFQLRAAGKSNSDNDRDTWTSGNVTTTFEYVNWESTGWVNDENGDTALRLSGDAKATINFMPFKSDARDTGKTIEMEFAIRDVNNRDAVAISCLSGRIGFTVTADTATLNSEQITIGCNYTDEEKVRVAFVIEPDSEYCMMSVYLNGVLSGVKQYSDTDDNFQQVPPVNITVGSPYCSVDLYAIRSYDVALTQEEIRDNYIADIADVSEKLALYEANNIYDDFGSLSFSALKDKIPVLVITGALPTFKGDKRKVTVTYTDPFNPSLNFEDSAQIDVQGTSSAGYVRKNWKIKTSEPHILDLNQVETKVLCWKVDYAEATGTHNTGNANYAHIFYGDVKTPPQEVDDRVRTTIYGRPCVIFHKADSGSEPVFYGKSNSNVDKGGEEVFGFTEDYPDAQCVEFCNNDAAACKFQGEIPDDWAEDTFEFRYPDGYEDISDFKIMHDWVVSTWQDGATGNALAEVYVGVDGKRYTNDTAEYRLAKFKKEFNEHFDFEFMLIYYLYTFVILMVDQRAKNMFLTTWDKKHWQAWLYDNDTCFGINNVGELSFDYYHEDHDPTGDKYVYNGAESALWVNFRESFPDEIRELYAEWRKHEGNVEDFVSYDSVQSLLSYENIIEYFITRQSDKWCISVYNEDADFKYISMLRSDNNARYLFQVRGTGEEHLKYFVKNRLMYCDSKWNAGYYPDDRVILRLYTPAGNVAVTPNHDITVTPFSNIYAGVKYNANGVLQQQRAEKNIPVTFKPSADSEFGDTDTYIYGASEMSSIGDLSPMYCGYVDVSKATKLTELIIGSGVSGYTNTNLKTVAVGTNKLLKKIDVRNCPSLVDPLSLSNCPNIQEIYATGSGITGVELPKSGYLKKAYLPGTLTNLTVTNQKYIEEFELEGYDNLTTLRIEDTVNIPVEDIMLNAPNLNRIRLIDVQWEAESEAALVQTIEKFKSCLGLDANGNNTDNAVVTGRVHVAEKVSDKVFGDIYNSFPDLVVDDGSGDIYVVNYKDRNGDILYSTRVSEGASAIDPIEAGYIEMPEPIVTETYRYEFIGWSTLPTNITRHYIIIAQYHTKFAIKFYNGDEHIYSQWSVQGDAAEDPVKTGAISAPTKEGTSDISYKFSGWDNLPTNVQASISVYAKYDIYWAARFWNDNKIHYTEWVLNGNDAVAPNTSLDHAYVDPIRTSTVSTDYTFNKWASRWGGTKKWLTLNEFNQLVDSGDTNITAADFTNMTSARDYIVVYKETTRKYIVGFYDDSGTLIPNYEYEVSYGSVPSKVPSGTQIKHGVENPDEYMFKGWYPSPSEVITGETVYKPLFKFTGYLFGRLGKTPEDDRGYGTVDNPNWTKINAYWNTIASDITSYKNGALSEDNFFAQYPIGGRMLIQSSLSALETSAISIVEKPIIDVEIIGHNHDDLSDGSGKAPLTFFCLDLPEIIYWMNPTQTNIGGWEACALRTFTNDELFDSLPDELKAILKPVYKISDGGGGNRTLVSVVDKCWLASADEIGASGQQNALVGQGVTYSSVFTDNQSSKKYLINTASFERWRLRSTDYPGETSFLRVTNNSGGLYSDNGANNGIMTSGSYYIAFGFCI